MDIVGDVFDLDARHVGSLPGLAPVWRRCLPLSARLGGEPVVADIVNMQALLDQSLQSWLQHLKDAAERG